MNAKKLIDREQRRLSLYKKNSNYSQKSQALGLFSQALGLFSQAVGLFSRRWDFWEKPLGEALLITLTNKEEMDFIDHFMQFMGRHR
jgi:hypothetical protein